VKQLVRRGLESVIGRVAPGTWRLRGSPQLVVLTYHRVLPAAHPDRKVEQPGMYVSPQTLAMHLRELRKHFEIVHLDDWIDRSTRGATLPSLACAVTFDDGWRDNYEHGFPVLQKEQVPATIFLVSDMTGRPGSFWPNRFGRLIARVCRAGTIEGLPQALQELLVPMLGTIRACREPALLQIDSAIVRAKAFEDREMKRLLDEAETRFPPEAGDRDILSWDEVRLMSDSGLVRFGSHSRTHQRMNDDLSCDVLESEIGQSRDEIRQQTGRPVRLFCYPNGDTTSKALEVVRRHYDGAVTTKKGWNEPTSDRCLIRRISMHDDVSRRRDSFLARVSTWI
jgi:peptidoglycan/xylan/chitin deacetylase (PgdA/CDA1 family)